MLNDKLTLVILSCAKFSDIWEGHVKQLERYWGDRGIKTLLVSDGPTEQRFEGIEILTEGGDLSWTERMKLALTHVDTEYFLFTLDDYFLVKPVENQVIEDLLDKMDERSLDYIRLFHQPNSQLKMEGTATLYHADYSRSRYVVNLYAGLWRKSFMEQTLTQPMTVWEYEVSLTDASQKLGARCAMSKGEEFVILDVVRKGKLLHKAARYLKKHDLYHGDRTVIAYREEFRLWLFTTIKGIFPRPLIRWLKRIGSKCGMTFYSGTK